GAHVHAGVPGPVEAHEREARHDRAGPIEVQVRSGRYGRLARHDREEPGTVGIGGDEVHDARGVRASADSDHRALPGLASAARVDEADVGDVVDYLVADVSLQVADHVG